jgi:hypothetical protein
MALASDRWTEPQAGRFRERALGASDAASEYRGLGLGRPLACDILRPRSYGGKREMQLRRIIISLKPQESSRQISLAMRLHRVQTSGGGALRPARFPAGDVAEWLKAAVC